MSSPRALRHATHLGGRQAFVCSVPCAVTSRPGSATTVHGEVQQAQQLLSHCLYILLASRGRQDLASGSHFPYLATNITLLLKSCDVKKIETD